MVALPGPRSAREALERRLLACLGAASYARYVLLLVRALGNLEPDERALLVEAAEAIFRAAESALDELERADACE